MTEPGGIELYLYWKSTEDLNRKPNFQVVAIPLVVETEANALLVRGQFIQLQILNKYVQDSDLDKAVLGECSGYLTVYPGYTSRKMQPPTSNVKTYSISWASVYIADEERSSFTVTMRASDIKLGDGDDYFWGRFG